MGCGMLYVKANSKTSTSIWLERLSAISTAPARSMTYPIEPERLILPSLQASAPLLLGFHRISSIRAWSTSRAIP